MGSYEYLLNLNEYLFVETRIPHKCPPQDYNPNNLLLQAIEISKLLFIKAYCGD